MENRNRMIFLVLIAIVIVVAVFSSFGLNLFGTTDEVRFPDSTPTGGTQDPFQSGQPTGSVDFVKVEVTTETVQNVVATLSRPARYYRRVAISTFRSDGTEDVQNSLVLVADGWTWTETALSDTLTRYTIVGDETVYRWYSGDSEAKSWPADPRSADVEGQRILTYEDVLDLDPAEITGAGYEERDGRQCIYVEVEQKEQEYRSRYWISVQNGLLTEAERWSGDRLIYRMTTGSMEQSLSAEFTLPDGTVLYRTS